MEKMHTKSGFTFKFKDTIFDDFELFDFLEQADSGNVLAIPRILRHLLNDTDIKRLYDHCRAEDGHVSAKKMEDTFFEMIEAMNTLQKGKNS